MSRSQTISIGSGGIQGSFQRSRCGMNAFNITSDIPMKTIDSMFECAGSLHIHRKTNEVDWCALPENSSTAVSHSWELLMSKRISFISFLLDWSASRVWTTNLTAGHQPSSFSKHPSLQTHTSIVLLLLTHASNRLQNRFPHQADSNARLIQCGCSFSH